MVSEMYLENVLYEFRGIKTLADKAIAQVTGENLFAELDERSNSIAIIMKHLTGNLRSRWTDFLTSDGEKPNRRRDTEFELTPEDTPESLRQRWEAAWQPLFDTIKSLKPEDLTKTVYIRTEPHSVIAAINRHLTHYADHVGQIVYLARHFAGEDWQTLSVPRGKSEEFNLKMQKTEF